MTSTRSPLPSTRDERWNYTPVDELAAMFDAARPAESRPVGADVVDTLAGRLGGSRLGYVNGVCAEALSDGDRLPHGLRRGLSAGPDRAELIEVDPGAHLDEPIHIVHVDVPGSALTVSRPRTIIELGEGSDVCIVETYCGLPGAIVTSAATTIRARRGVRLHHVRIQDATSAAVHVGHTRAEMFGDAHVRAVSIMVGADIARHEIDVEMREPGAHLELHGLALPRGQQRHDIMVTVDHAASHCASSQHFRAVVDDRARSAFSSHVIVRPDTVATSAHQTSRNLVLSSDAEADARPWLEILADDVRCTHGATVGRLDHDALFYLRSRGIHLDEARALLIDAFVAAVLDAVEHVALREHLDALIHRNHIPPIGEPEEQQ